MLGEPWLWDIGWWSSLDSVEWMGESPIPIWVDEIVSGDLLVGYASRVVVYR